MKLLFLLILIIFSFLTPLIQGMIALLTVGFLSRGEWIWRNRENYFKFVNLLLIPLILFVLIIPFIKYYPFGKVEGIWFNPLFFVVRNLLFLFLTYLFAYLFKNNQKEKYAILYLLSFVISESLIAFDVILPLEYPFYSTLLGGYFFVESFFMALAINHFIISKVNDRDILHKNSSMIFGFSLIWAGLMFTQLLVIWYGNIPEETNFLIKRISVFPFNYLSLLVLLFCFAIPFPSLAPKKTKLNIKFMNFISILIILGIFIERLVIILPVFK